MANSIWRRIARCSSGKSSERPSSDLYFCLVAQFSKVRHPQRRATSTRLRICSHGASITPNQSLNAESEYKQTLLAPEPLQRLSPAQLHAIRPRATAPTTIDNNVRQSQRQHPTPRPPRRKLRPRLHSRAKGRSNTHPAMRAHRLLRHSRIGRSEDDMLGRGNQKIVSKALAVDAS